MPEFENFEAWVKAIGGQEALVSRFKKKFGEKTAISQSAISGWIKRRRVPEGERRDQLDELGYRGPMDWSEFEGVAEDAPSYHVTGALPEHVQEAYKVVREALDIAKADISTMDQDRVGLVIGLAAEEIARGNRAEARQTLLRRAEVLLGLKAP